MTSPADVFAQRLRLGERVVWSGRPVEGVRFRPIDWLLVPFSLMWGGFAIFSEAAALGIGAATRKGNGAEGGFALIFPLFGMPFVFVGLFIIFGRFWLDAWLRGGVSYALTDQRALISQSRGGRSFRTVELTDNVRLSGLKRDGTGTIAFGPGLGAAGLFGAHAGLGLWVPALGPGAEFALIPDAERVFDLLQREVSVRRER